jgi:ADP-heptose:LPS heptosyltransferase
MSKITKSQKRKKNTVQYGKNPWKNFFPENEKKSGKNSPVGNYKKLIKNLSIKLFRYRYKAREIC